VVLDRDGIGGGETGRTTAHLTAALDARYRRLERFHGPEGARMAAASHAAAIEIVASQATRVPQECRFERWTAISSIQTTAIRMRCTRKRRPPAGRDSRWRSCPRRPCPSRRDAASASRGRARCTRCATWRFGGGGAREPWPDLPRRGHEFEDGEPTTVRTRLGPRVRARSLVIATDSPVNDRFVIHTKQASSRTYAIAFAAPERVPRGLFWDTLEPYHYLRRARVDPTPARRS